MSSQQLTPQKHGPHKKRSHRLFWTALSAIVVITIFLGVFIAWLLVTQDLTKATSIIGLIAGIVAILFGPITLLFTVLKWPEREQTGEGILQLNPHTHFIAVSSEAGTSQAVTMSQPVEELSQMLLNPTTQKRRTPNTRQSKSSMSHAKEATPMSTQKKFDVFLSYSSIDKSWVTDLKDALKTRGLKVWLDRDEIRPGDLFVGALEKGLEESNTVVLVVSPETMASGWVKEEYSRAMSLAQSKTQPLRLIPIILRDLPDAELPGFLANRNWVDFRDASTFDKSFEQLIWGITDKKSLGGAEPINEAVFHVRGPLPGDSALYVERKADQAALNYLRRMDYISLIEPRQQGKTSLIYRLMHRLSPQGYTFVICDLGAERFRKNSEEEWYKSLGTWLLNKLSFVSSDAHIALPTQGISWETFLIGIAEAAKRTKQKVVIVLDEIREMPPTYATPFFTVVRSIYNERAISPSFEHLTFIISGAFNPDELIQDENVSKFNVDQRIHLEDFNLSQVRQLVAHLQLPDNVTETATKRIYYWTDGQPYLTQKLCLLLTEEREPGQLGSLSGMIDKLAKQLHSDESYLQRIKRFSEKEPALLTYVQNIARDHQRPKFYPALNKEHFRLAFVYGVIKADADGRCRIRNRICEQALMNIG